MTKIRPSFPIKVKTAAIFVIFCPLFSLASDPDSNLELYLKLFLRDSRIAAPAPEHSGSTLLNYTPSTESNEKNFNQFRKDLTEHYSGTFPAGWFEELPHSMGSTGGEEAHHTARFIREIFADPRGQTPKVERVFSEPFAFITYYQMLANNYWLIKFQNVDQNQIEAAKILLLNGFKDKLFEREPTWQDATAVLLTLKLGVPSQQVRNMEANFDPGLNLLKDFINSRPEILDKYSYLFSKWQFYFAKIPLAQFEGSDCSDSLKK